ncbi:hypothetical protein [Streptomyces erythrochromogenes]|uniref:hypothetical protein n=1 Tax=Streptomyces erythrochromogenes TaxID=285574 RepID=UPI0037D41ABF
MAFYIVVDGRKNEYGEADTFVVRAGGRRQAIALAPVINRKDAEVTKLEDGRDVPNGVILSSLADFTEPHPSQDFDSELVEPETLNTVAEETVTVSPEAPRYAVI